MTRAIRSLAAATMMAGLLASANVATAAPSASSLSFAAAGASHVETVQFRGRGGYYRGGRGIGLGIGAGILGGAILGGALAAPYYYRPYYGPSYYAPPPPAYYAPGPGGDAVQYCAQRFRSYDPRTGTYMGYDGYRHPCP